MTLSAVQWCPYRQLYSDDLARKTYSTLFTNHFTTCRMVMIFPSSLLLGWWNTVHLEWWRYLQNAMHLDLLTEMLHIWAQFTWLPHLHQRCCGQTASHPPPSALVASAQPVSEVKRTCVCYADSNTMWSTELSSGKVLSAISVVFLTCTTTTTRYNWSYYPSIQTCNNTTKCCSWCVAALGLMLGVFSGACVLVGRGIYFYFYFLLLCWLPYWLRFYIAGCVNLGVWFTNAWMLLCLKTD